MFRQISYSVVKSHVTDHLLFNKLFNPHQVAYCKHHSTETSLLCIHLINAVGSQKLSCLCFLDLDLPPLTPSTITSESLASHLGSVYLFSAVSRRTCHLAPSVSDVIILSRPCRPIPLPMVFWPKAPLWVPCLLIMYTIPLPEPPTLCRRHSTFFLLSPIQLRLKHYSRTKCHSFLPR